MIDLLLVGSDHIFLPALAMVIEDRVPECRVSAQSHTLTDAAVILAEQNTITTAIVDLDHWTGDLVTVMEDLRRQRPELAVLLLTDPETAHLVPPLGEAGATQVVDKSQPLSAILDGVRRLTGRASEPSAGVSGRN